MPKYFSQSLLKQVAPIPKRVNQKYKHVLRHKKSLNYCSEKYVPGSYYEYIHVVSLLNGNLYQRIRG